MQRRGRLLITFVSFLIFAVLVITVAHFAPSISDFLESIFSGTRGPLFSFSRIGSFENAEVKKFRDENLLLKKKIKDFSEIERDNKALHDQFSITTPSPSNLVPARIVGMKGFIPGVSKPENIVIDKGKNEGVKTGSAILYKDNLVGIVAKTANHFSEVTLLADFTNPFTARTLKTNTLGILHIVNNSIVLSNVQLSETLEKGDLVVTKGDMDSVGKGLPADIIIGKITSVRKQASNLFQAAEVESLIDVSKLDMVFVVVNK